MTPPPGGSVPAEQIRSDAPGERREAAPLQAVPRVALVGSPNVGKSVLFNALTGAYVTVSNYPGTTVEVSRGQARLDGRPAEIIDTPGMYGLLPISDEERVARQILLDERPDVVVHVVDAKNLDRMLPLTVQLVELGVPLVLVLNMMDESRRLGLEIDVEALSSWLGVPVVPAVAPTGEGVAELGKVLAGLPTHGRRPESPVLFDPDLEDALEAVTPPLQAHYGRGARALALLLLQGDPSAQEEVQARAPEAVAAAAKAREALLAEGDDPTFAIVRQRHDACRDFLAQVVGNVDDSRRTLSERVGEWLIKPVIGVPVLLTVLYLGLYQFVGVFGAGTVVDFLESRIFGEWVNPRVEGWLSAIFPGDSGWTYWAHELIGGDYGLVTLGLTYAVAIVLPIVFLFFLFFSVLEDSGYFPRLAMLVDRLFKRIGLNGRAVIPIVLGFACDTMATMVTRIQETKRERVITTFLLALAIPCSAQYGVIAALLAAQPGQVLGMSYAFLTWIGLVGAIFFVNGLVASKMVKGTPASFYMELPPMRLPRPGNVLAKTLARMKWYFVEIIPFFLLASVLIWLGRLTGLFGVLIEALHPVVRLLGLPEAASEIFLYGFFRRDFGAAGLWDLMTGPEALGTGQLLVAGVVLTLFIPCVAQLLVMVKERGAKTAAFMVAIIMTMAFLIGGLTHAVLRLLGVM